MVPLASPPDEEEGVAMMELRSSGSRTARRSGSSWSSAWLRPHNLGPPEKVRRIRVEVLARFGLGFGPSFCHGRARLIFYGENIGVNDQRKCPKWSSQSLPVSIFVVRVHVCGQIILA